MSEPVELREHCGGWEIHYTSRVPGQTLQGWYRTREEAEAVLRRLQGGK